jgi:hypothetical protein
MEESAFFKKFQGALKIATDEDEFSDENSITSFEVGDCITVFGINKEKGKISGIFGCHFDSLSDESEIKEPMKETLQKGSNYQCELYIIGGNGSKDSQKCLKNTHMTISKLQSKYTVNTLGECTNPNAGTNCTYVSANLQMDGTLTFCRHN